MTEETIKKNVVDQLYWDTRVDASNVKVEVDDGKVRLEGAVPTYNSRLAAGLDAAMTAGIAQVENNLKVNFPETVPVPTDEDIKTSIRSVLRWHPDIDDSDIKVEVNAGLVKLSGNVYTYWEKMLAEDSASNVRGVLDVTNELAVVPSIDFVDKTIADDIISAFERNIHVNPENIDVSVLNGKVTLSGTVPNRTAYDAAMNIARYTAGVIDVTDDLLIS